MASERLLRLAPQTARWLPEKKTIFKQNGPSNSGESISEQPAM